MVLIEDAAGDADVRALARAGIPRQFESDVEVIADDAGLGGAIRLLFQPLQLLVELLVGLLRQVELLDLLAVFIDLRVLVVFAELAADDLELLTQIIIALALVDALLRLLLQLGLEAQDLQLPRKQPVRRFQTAHRRKLGQNAHFFLIVIGCRLRRHVGRRAGILFGQQMEHDVLHRALRQLRIFAEQLDGLPKQGLRARRNARCLLLGDRLDARHHARRRLQHLRGTGAVFALHQHTHGVAGDLQDLQDMGDRADLIEIAEAGIILLDLLLGHQKNVLVGVHRRLQRANGLLPPHIKVHGCLRKKDQPAHGEHRHPFRQNQFVHSSPSSPPDAGTDHKRGAQTPKCPQRPLLCLVILRSDASGAQRRSCAGFPARFRPPRRRV